MSGFLAKIIGLYEIVIIVRIILTWVPHNANHPAAVFLHKITEPVLEPVRRIIPSIGGIDISPIIVFIILDFAKRAFGG